MRAANYILVVGLIDPNGHDMLGPSCRSGTDLRLRMAGQYKLVINAGDGGFGPYHSCSKVRPALRPRRNRARGRK